MIDDKESVVVYVFTNTMSNFETFMKLLNKNDDKRTQITKKLKLQNQKLKKLIHTTFN